mgnify:CR=1 FL=1
MLIAVLSSFSFLPGQWLLQSESLAAMFQYGLPEAAAFLAHALVAQGGGTLQVSAPDSDVLLFGASFRVG